MLKSLNYKNIDIANDGEDTMQKILNPEKLYDVLLLDLRMPKKNGYEVIEELNKTIDNTDTIQVQYPLLRTILHNIAQY